MITIHIHENREAGLDAFDVQMPEAQFARLQAIMREHGWTLEETVHKALDGFFAAHWPTGVPRPSKDPVL